MPPSLSEAQIEAQVRDYFLRAGWYPVKTDSAMVIRGTRGRVSRGHLPIGFPDLTMIRSLPGTDLTLAALIEMKTPTGRIREAQVERHAELRDLYGIPVHVIRDPTQATHLITQARRIIGALQGVTL